MTYGMLGNQYSWLFDHKARLSICVNGQLMLSMLIEKFFQNGIILIDANTDGTYIYVHKSKKEKLQEIISWWESVTKMKMEQVKFEKMWFLNTADYFGTYYKDGKLKVKEKGIFLSEVQLGKGMEFPIIPNAVKSYFLQNKDYREYIKENKNILNFCTYKKLQKNKGYECFHNETKQQLVNRYYACNKGAYLFRRKTLVKKDKVLNDEYTTYQYDNLLKDSPVIILNKLDNKPIQERNINYPFYINKVREIIYSIEGDKNQISLF